MDEEIVDDENQQDELLDAQQEYQEGAIDSLDANYPIAKEQQGLYQTLWKMIQRKDSTKIANLLKQELGDPQITVRDAQHLTQLGNTFNNDIFAEYFKGHAEITLATSMSREGWLGELFISQKKFSTKSKKSSSPLTPQKWKLFNKTPAQGQ